MADNDEEGKRREESTQIYQDISKATISPAFQRSNELFDARNKEPPPEHLLHFAPAVAVASILPNRTLRVSRARSSNDPKELDHGISVAREEQEKLTKSASDEIFRDELFATLSGRMTDGREAHLMDPHISCFTETDSAHVVAHWAMYGRDGSGFALKFKGKELKKKVDVRLAKVNYDEVSQREHMRELLVLARETSERAGVYAKENHGGAWVDPSVRIAARAFGGVISLHAAAMKAPEFAAEKEWRLVHPGFQSELNRGLEAKGPILRTYFELKFEADDLLSIIVGPVHADLNRPVVWQLLRDFGYANTTVETGKVALRTL
jgi:hypothetical protein